MYHIIQRRLFFVFAVVLVGIVAIVGCSSSDETGVNQPDPDTTAPQTVTDLRIDYFDAIQIVLGWTTPGDDGDAGTADKYDIRYATSQITESTWASATKVTTLHPPVAAGVDDTLTVQGLAPATTYYFCLKTADEASNWSGLSNVVSSALQETDPPDQVIDLAVSHLTSSSATLTWTAPGDDGDVGTASQYNIRYDFSTITEGNWHNATWANNVPAPSPAGTAETFTIEGLLEDRTYYFGLKTIDDAGNWSVLSNVVSGATPESFLRQVTDQQYYSYYYPAWSPQGNRLVFFSTIDEVYGIWWVYEDTGGPPNLVINGPGMVNNDRPDWSHNGALIAYSSGPSQNDADIMIIPVSGGSPTRLTNDPAGEVSPEFSPDDTKIVFSRSGAGIWTVPVSGGTPTQVVAVGASPCWSPDGNQIAFVAWDDGDADIYVVPASGGTPQQITTGPGAEYDPTWSPDGTRIAYSSDLDGTHNIWVSPASGGQPEQLTTDGGLSPDWSPNGDKIAFVSGRFIWTIMVP